MDKRIAVCLRLVLYQQDIFSPNPEKIDNGSQAMSPLSALLPAWCGHKNVSQYEGAIVPCCRAFLFERGGLPKHRK